MEMKLDSELYASSLHYLFVGTHSRFEASEQDDPFFWF